MPNNTNQQTHVDELLVLSPIIRPPRLVLEHHIIIPSPLHVKVRLVEQRVPEGDVALARLLLDGSLFALLALSLLGPLAPDLLQFSL